jgi:Site-specific recombinase XerD
MLREDNSALYLSIVQKGYPIDSSPAPTTLGLADDVARLLSSSLKNRLKDTEVLFPSRSADRCTTQAVCDMLHKLAAEAGIEPYNVIWSRGDAGDVTPHALRHNVAYRMMSSEEGNNCMVFAIGCDTVLFRQPSRFTITSIEYEV